VPHFQNSLMNPFLMSDIQGQHLRHANFDFVQGMSHLCEYKIIFLERYSSLCEKTADLKTNYMNIVSVFKGFLKLIRNKKILLFVLIETKKK